MSTLDDEIKSLQSRLETLETQRDQQRGLITEGPAKGEPNPFHRRWFNLSKQGELVRKHGLEAAEAAAKACGTTIGSTKGGDL